MKKGTRSHANNVNTTNTYIFIYTNIFILFNIYYLQYINRFQIVYSSLAVCIPLLAY